MSNPRSADEAYYASKTPLVFAQTQEGPRVRKPPVSYKQVTAGSTDQFNSKRYYAELQSGETGPVVLDSTQVSRQAVVEQVKQNPNVRVTGDSEQIRQVQTRLDMAVGQGDLTREAVDSVQYQETLPEPKPAGTKADEALFLQPPDDASRGRKRRKKDGE